MSEERINELEKKVSLLFTKLDTTNDKLNINENKIIQLKTIITGDGEFSGIAAQIKQLTESLKIMPLSISNVKEEIINSFKEEMKNHKENDHKDVFRNIFIVLMFIVSMTSFIVNILMK